MPSDAGSGRWLWPSRTALRVWHYVLMLWLPEGSVKICRRVYTHRATSVSTRGQRFGSKYLNGLLRRVTHSWFSILHLLLPTLYSISLLMQPTRIGRSIRNLRGHLSDSATRLCIYCYLVARFLPSYYLYFLLWVSLYRSVLVLSPAQF